MGFDAHLNVNVMVSHAPYIMEKTAKKKAIEAIGEKGKLPTDIESIIDSMSEPTHFCVPKIEIPFSEYILLCGTKWFQLFEPFRVNQGYPEREKWSLNFLLDFFYHCVHTKIIGEDEKERTYELELEYRVDGEPDDEIQWNDLYSEMESEELNEFMADVLGLFEYCKKLKKIQDSYLISGHYVSFVWEYSW